MTLNEVCERLSLTHVCGGLTREWSGVYVGDLLSRCMSRVEEGCLWITIMSNINAVAVASLTDPACIVFCEDVDVDDDVIAKAQANDITIAKSPLSAYALCTAYHTAENSAS